jgi:hypothetical protein
MSTTKRVAALRLFAALFVAYCISLPVKVCATAGTICTNTNWSGTIHVTGDVLVCSGVTLTIDAGTQVSIDPTSSSDIGTIPAQMAGKVDIYIQGHLQVNGSSGSHVVFHSNAGSPTGSDWYQLLISGTITSTYMELSNCEYGLALNTTGAVSVSFCDFSENDDDDITIGANPSSCSISGCSFDVGEGAGIKVASSAAITVSSCSITGDGDSSNGIEASSSTTVTVSSNNISGFDNAGDTANGVLLAGTSTGTLTDNHIESCDNGIHVTATAGSGATAYIGAEDDGNEIETSINGILMETIGPGSCPASTPYATIRYNWIHNNTNGIKTIKTASGVDAGVFVDYGFNKIENNSSYGVNNTSSCGTVTARGNNWGRNGSNQCIAAVTNGSVDANEIWCPGSGEPGGCHDCPYGVAPDDRPAISRTSLTGISPNPFNPETTIHFALSSPAQPTIAIYNVAGQLVRGEELGLRSAGANEWVWDGRDGRGNALASGIYFVQLQVGAVTDVKKAVLLK